MMGASERPTLTPPFDPEAFARESESKLRVSRPASSGEPREIASSTKLRRADPRDEASFDDLFTDDFDRSTTEIEIPKPPALTLESVPVLAMDPTRIVGFKLDHRAGFVLSHVDGLSNVETILDVSGMSSEEALKILNELAQMGVIRAS